MCRPRDLQTGTRLREVEVGEGGALWGDMERLLVIPTTLTTGPTVIHHWPDTGEI